MKVLKRALLILAIVLVVALVLAVVGMGVLDKKVRAETDATRARLRADLAMARDRIIEDQRALAGHWLFERRVGGGDASDILEPRTGWVGGSAARAGDSGVPAALVQTIKGWGQEWASHVDDADLTGVDLAWMKDLDKLDHWDLEREGSPMNQRPWHWHDAPTPSFITLQSAAKARLLVGLRAGDPAGAAAEVRELARLSASTETLIGDMVAVALVRVTIKARAVAEQRKLDLSAWPRTTDDEADRLRRALWSASAFFQPLAVDDTMEQHIVAGRCTALLEGGAGALWLRGFLEDRYADRYRSLTESITRSPCRLKNLRRAWNGKDHEGEMSITTDLLCGDAIARGGAAPPGCRLAVSFARLPLAKEAIGEILLTVSAPSWFKYYLDAPQH